MMVAAGGAGGTASSQSASQQAGRQAARHLVVGMQYSLWYVPAARPVAACHK